MPHGAYPAGAVVNGPQPRDMTNFTLALAAVAGDPGARSRRTTFALYETRLARRGAQLTVGSTQAMAVAAFVDGAYAGAAHDLTHGDGRSVDLTIDLASAREVEEPDAEGATLTLLAEELGYANYGFKGRLEKGVVGTVSIDGNASAVGAGGWHMRGGLAGEQLELLTDAGAARVKWADARSATHPATWYRTTFTTPSAVAAGGARLLFNASGLNRGRIWINGYDAGRFYLKPRNDASQCPEGASACATQTLYYLPKAWLSAPGTENVLTIFEAGGIGAVGGSLPHAGLALASMQAGSGEAGGDVLGSVTSCEF